MFLFSYKRRKKTRQIVTRILAHTRMLAHTRPIIECYIITHFVGQIVFRIVTWNNVLLSSYLYHPVSYNLHKTATSLMFTDYVCICRTQRSEENKLINAIFVISVAHETILAAIRIKYPREDLWIAGLLSFFCTNSCNKCIKLFEEHKDSC